MPSSRAGLLLALALACGGPGRLLADPAAAGEPRLVERILAVVDDHPILLSETRLVERLHGDARRAALDALIDEWLMYREAGRLPQAEVTPDEEARAVETLARRLGGEGGDRAAMRRLARRQTAIVKYIEFRFRPQVRVEDEAVAARAGRDATPGAREAARARLEAEDLDRRIEEWVKELRSGADVRYAEDVPTARPGS